MLFGRPRPAAAARFLASSLLGVLALAVAGAVTAQAGGQSSAASDSSGAGLPQVESVRLSEHPEGIELTVSASAPLRWTVRDLEDGELTLRLLDCRPGPPLPELRPDEGLVESVVVAASETAERPETWVSIRPRGQIKYRVATGERSVTMLLISRQPPPEPEPPTPEPEPPSPELAPPASQPAMPEPEPTPTDVDASVPAPEPVVGPGPPPSGARAGAYRIGAGDVLAIDVYGLDELDRKVRVQSDGRISLPLLDDFEVAGLDLEGAERLIAGILRDRDLVREPQVSIVVDELVSRAINVQGAVVHPGVYQLIGDKTLLELLGEAGGIREDNGARVLVLRTENGEQRRMELDLKALIGGLDRSLNIPLLPGDVIMVPFSRQLTVYVTGAVEQPGPVTFQSSDGITVLQAIIAAGGPTPRANLKNVHLLRKTPGGGQQKIEVNIKKIQSGKVDDVALERNDTVVVGEWFF